MTNLPLLLSALLAFPTTPPAGEPWLSIWDGETHRDVAGASDAPTVLVVLPATSKSPLVTRATPVDGEVQLRVAPRPGFALREVHVRRYRHGSAERVLACESEPFLIGAITLPSSATDADGTGRLEHVARLDGNTARLRGKLTAPKGLPHGASTVQIFEGGGVRIAPAAEPLLDPGAHEAVDQVFFATTRRLAAEEGELLYGAAGVALPGTEPDGSLLLNVPLPLDTEGSGSWTLVATFEFEVAPDPGHTSRASDEPRPEPWPWTDEARARGLDFVHFEGPEEQLDIRPTMGPGAAFGDVDRDGFVDLYLVQGSGRAGSDAPQNQLYLGTESGSFELAPRANGADHPGAGMGALFFDADGDRDLDLYVANYGPDAFFSNDGDGNFTDVSDQAGVGGNLWSAGVAAADYDGDGDLDLYVTSYLDYDPDKMPAPEELGRYRREDPLEMLPFAFPGQRNVFLRNDAWMRKPGSGAVVPGPVKFTEVTAELGLLDEAGRGMQPVFWDFDRDGDQDLYVANDVSYNVLFRNEGDGSFRDVSFSTGMDDPRGGMGVAVGDVEGDGDEDLFLTNWQLDTNGLYLNNLISHQSRKHRVATFRDGIVEAGLGPAAIGVTSWGAELFDADNDGDLDLFVANGYTSPDYESTGICVGQPNQYFENAGRGKFVDRSAEAGPAVLEELPSRGAVGCDFDRDGDVDLLVTANNQRTQLLVNQHENDNHWLGVRLENEAPNTFGIGAEVTLFAGDKMWRRSLRAGGSYLCGNAPELHFGLGPLEELERIEVRWPSGQLQVFAAPELNTFVTLKQHTW